MTAPIIFFVKGMPVAQPRGRAGYHGRKLTVYDSGRSRPWKYDIALACNRFREREPIDGPIRADADFYFPAPAKERGASLVRWRPAKGRHDRDNLEKALLDALGPKGNGLLADDGIVVAGEVRKLYAPTGGMSGLLVRIQKLDPKVPTPPGPILEDLLTPARETFGLIARSLQDVAKAIAANWPDVMAELEKHAEENKSLPEKTRRAIREILEAGRAAGKKPKADPCAGPGGPRDAGETQEAGPKRPRRRGMISTSRKGPRP